VHRDRLYAQFTASPLYAQRNRTAVRYEDFFEHGDFTHADWIKTRPAGRCSTDQE